MSETLTSSPLDAGSTAARSERTDRQPPLPFAGARAVVVSLLLTPVCSYWASAQGVDVILSLIHSKPKLVFAGQSGLALKVTI